MSAGTRVASGRLRVDAARAVDKLRDYQLPDPTLWILEVIRAAVLGGATRIAVTGDGDDVRVAWEGPPIPTERLTTLFDELVDPAPRADRRHLRLLATGINTALGLDPRWVDVTTLDDEAHVVRFTPSLLEAKDGVAEGLRALAPEPTTPPAAALGRGVVVHLKRLPQWNAVPLMLGIGEPAELGVVRRACDDLTVPITVGGGALGRDTSHRDLLRVALGHGLDGFIAVMDPSAARGEAKLELAELGVLLATYSWPLKGVDGERVGVPLRLFLDAQRLPTNASRSAVRLEDPPVRDALERAEALLPKAVERLAKQLDGEPEHAFSGAQLERLRAAALHLLAARGTGRLWRASLPTRVDDAAFLAPLTRLPLLRDALGRPRTPLSFPLGEGEDFVSFAAAPLEAELEPWLGNVLWVPPGDPARALLGDWVPERAARLARAARKHQRARERFLEEQRRPNTLAASDVQLVEVPLKAPGRSLKSLIAPSWFQVPGLDGELALLDPRRARDGAISVRLDGREIELVRPERSLLYDAVATCDGLTPRIDFRGAERDGRYHALRWALDAAAVVACEGLALRMLDASKPGDRCEVRASWVESPDDDERALLARVLRRGVYLATTLLGPDGADDDERARCRETLAASKSPLVRAEIWRTVDGAFHDLKSVLRDSGPLGACFGAAPGGPTPSGRLVLSFDAAERDEAVDLFGPMIDYRPVLVRERSQPEEAALARRECPPNGAALEIEGTHLRATVVWGGDRNELEVRHWGRTLERRLLEGAIPPTRVVVEDGLVVPDAGWQGVETERLDGYPFARWRRDLARAFVDALAGAPPPTLAVGAERALDAHGALQALFELIEHAEETPAALLTRGRLTRLGRAPLFSRLNLVDRVSLDDLMAAFREDPVPWVPVGELAGVELDGWHPLLATPGLIAALTRWTGRAFEDATPKLDALRRRARRDQALAAHRRQVPSDPTVTWARPRVDVKGRSYRSAVAAPALTEETGALIQASIEGRHFTVSRDPQGPPVWLAVDFEADRADEDFRGLTDGALSIARGAAWRGARELLRATAAESPSALADAPRIFAVLASWIARTSRSKADEKVRALVAEAPAWRTVQGERASVADASSSSGAVRVSVWDGRWLGPEEGERSSPLDGPVLALPADEARRWELREVLGALWGKGGTRDVTSALVKLQAKRRVDRGLERRPTLVAPTDPRFRYSLEELLEGVLDPRLEAVGLGEAALVRDRASRILIHERGSHTRSLDVNVIPVVHVAMTSPLIDEGDPGPLSGATRRRLVDAMNLIVAHVLRAVVDETPADELPEWVRLALRESCLAGDALHYERLEDVPMFRTTADAWVTPGALREQVERFGHVWYATGDLRAEPLDPDRVALSLEPREAERLGERWPVVDATEELRLEAIAKANQERPRLTSLALTEGERRAAAVTLPAAEDDDAVRGTLAVLRPGFEALRGIHLSRRMLPMGVHDDGERWPYLARVDVHDLEVNATWDGPAENGVRLALLRGALRAEVDGALDTLLPLPVDALVARRIRASEARAIGAETLPPLEGVIWLDASMAPGTLRVRDARGERTLEARDAGARGLPLHGRIWVAGTLASPRIPALAERLYALVVREAAERCGPRAEDASLLGHVLTASTLGVDLSSMSELTLSCFTPSIGVAALVRHLGDGERVITCAPDDLDAVEDAAAPRPIFVDDGGPVAKVVSAFLGAWAWPFETWLREQVLDDLPPPPPPAPIVVPATAPDESEAEPAAPRRESSPLEAALEARLAAMEVGTVSQVRVDGRRKRPLVGVIGGVVMIAGRHRAVQRISDAVEAGDPSADALVGLLAARVVGALHRQSGRIGRGGEMGLLVDLLA